MTFIANYATKDAGLSANDAAALVSYTGVASTTGRVAFGRLSKWIPQLVLLQGSVLVSGLAILLLGVAPPSYFVLALHAILFGFFSGSTIALLAPIIIGLVGLRTRRRAPRRHRRDDVDVHCARCDDGALLRARLGYPGAPPLVTLG
eukprot:CAMPEP_0180340740 /NCGR_PEP_ID=MMETSP0989-20121125/825_1 /TAXON_ID=697907 /ORGANISM="non described non described, Strain CCMP2293" /LENGTH=146 /DNA_ID=CAMNT_0022329473 /DNA_START=80 /DNA_END=520 /DNA_ORIENTATION=+